LTRSTPSNQHHFERAISRVREYRVIDLPSRVMIDRFDTRTWPQIVLTGFMGAGKSTLGSALATQLDIPFFDSDLLIEAETHTSIADLFRKVGEPRFRELEHECIARVAARPRTVLALGGGALMHPGTRLLLAPSCVVYLEVTVDTSRVRIGDPVGRPLAQSANLERLLTERDPIYRSTATFVLPERAETQDATLARLITSLTEHLSPEQTP
jgi:shikimate kinase